VADRVFTDGVVLLRGWRDGDAEWYAAAARDPVIQRYTAEPPGITAAQVRSAMAAGWTDAAGFVICDAASGERFGNVGLRHREGVGHASYWLAASARGRGVATRALRLLSGWAFADLDLSEMRLWTHVDNAASRLVAERAGYRRVPQDDQRRTVKGRTWSTVGYRLRRPVAPSAPGG
jgi:RimJ/RimL family protein N-acetyltransferase